MTVHMSSPIAFQSIHSARLSASAADGIDLERAFSDPVKSKMRATPCQTDRRGTRLMRTAHRLFIAIRNLCQLELLQLVNISLQPTGCGGNYLSIMFERISAQQ